MNFSEDLKAYLDGELDADRRLEIERELNTNESLRKELSELELIGGSIRAMAAQPLPNGLEQTLKALERRPVGRAKPGFRWLWGTGIAAAAALLLAVTLWPKRATDEGARVVSAASPLAMADKADDKASSVADDAPVTSLKKLAPQDKVVSPASQAESLKRSTSARTKNGEKFDTPKTSVPPNSVAIGESTVRMKNPVARFRSRVVKPSESDVQTVVVLCDSVPNGEARVRTILAKYPGVADANRKLGPVDFNPKIIGEVEIKLPAEQADRIVAEVQAEPVAMDSLAGEKMQGGLSTAAAASPLSAPGAAGPSGGGFVAAGRSAHPAESAGAAKDPTLGGVNRQRGAVKLKGSTITQAQVKDSNASQAKAKAPSPVELQTRSPFSNSVVVTAKKASATETPKKLAPVRVRTVRFVFKVIPPKKPVR